VYGRVIHCFDTDSERLAGLEDTLRRVTQERDELRELVDYTLRHGGAYHGQALGHDRAAEGRQAEGRPQVIRTLTELREGYRYPDDWNARCHEYGLPEYLEDVPGRGDRVVRAICWAARDLSDRLALRLNPDV